VVAAMKKLQRELRREFPGARIEATIAVIFAFDYRTARARSRRRRELSVLAAACPQRGEKEMSSNGAKSMINTAVVELTAQISNIT
jgi:hypothetical protein